MAIALPLLYLCAHLAIGIMSSLLLVYMKRIRSSFFSFNGLIALALLSIAFVLAYGRSGYAMLGACSLTLLFYLLTLRLERQGVSVSLLGVATVLGLAFLINDAVFYQRKLGLSTAGSLLYNFSSIAGVLLLGSVTVAMILGHWYLIIPNLPIGHLKLMTQVFLFSLLLKGSAVTALLAHCAGHDAHVHTIVYRLLSLGGHGLFFWLRVAVGLLGPLALAALALKTVDLRSTQSATGLLYVAVVLVLFGELIAKYLFALTWLPV